jgi:hypothetical protein
VQSLIPGFERGVPTDLSTGAGDKKAVTRPCDLAEMPRNASKWLTEMGTAKNSAVDGHYDIFICYYDKLEQ